MGCFCKLLESSDYESLTDEQVRAKREQTLRSTFDIAIGRSCGPSNLPHSNEAAEVTTGPSTGPDKAVWWLCQQSAICEKIPTISQFGECIPFHGLDCD